MSTEALLAINGLSHVYGSGSLRRQILYDVSASIEPGEIVILTGPSGSGKTTFLSLAGTLRSVQQGSIRIFGEELNGASPSQLIAIRRNIGFIFQHQNLLPSHTALENVELSLGILPQMGAAELRSASEQALESVGLGDHMHHYPDQLSGGQKQRVAIARALVRQPRIVFADEPTASLDRKAGREVVELMQMLVRRQECAILLVTHDHRILDVADRVLSLEDGRVSSFESGFSGNSSRLLTAISQMQDGAGLASYLAGMADNKFQGVVQQISQDLHWILETIKLGSRDELQSLIYQILEAVTQKIKLMLNAGKASLFIVDPESSVLYSRFARDIGHRADDPYVTGDQPDSADAILQLQAPGASSYLDYALRHEQDYSEGRLLCMPVLDGTKNVLAILEMIRGREYPAFTETDEKTFAEYAESLGLILEASLQIARQGQA